MTSSCNPFLTPLSWREYLYNNVLLPWETSKYKSRVGHFDKKEIQKNIGLELISKSKLATVDVEERKRSNHQTEFLVFYRKGPGWSPVFEMLRNMVAHGDFSCDRYGWLKVRHRFKGPRDRKEATRLFGRIKFSTLKALINFLDVSANASC